MYTQIRGGTRGGAAEFKWTDVGADKDRENYLGHSINAPTGRWQKNKDVHWYNRETQGSEEERLAEIRKIKEAEEEAMAIALGLKPAMRPVDIEAAGASTPAVKDEEAEKAKQAEKEERRKRKEEKRARKEEKRERKERKRMEHDRHGASSRDRREVNTHTSASARSRSRSPPNHRKQHSLTSRLPDREPHSKIGRPRSISRSRSPPPRRSEVERDDRERSRRRDYDRR